METYEILSYNLNSNGKFNYEDMIPCLETCVKIFNQPIGTLLESINHLGSCKRENCDFSFCYEFKTYADMMVTGDLEKNNFNVFRAFKYLLIAHAVFFCKDKECAVVGCYQNKTLADDIIQIHNFNESRSLYKDYNDNDFNP